VNLVTTLRVTYDSIAPQFKAIGNNMNSTGRYLLEKEKEYFDNRERVLATITSKRVADSPMLFTTRQGVTDLIARIDLFKLILEIPGHIVECGVNKGNSLMLYGHLSSILEPYAINRTVVGFDTFSGFRSINYEKDPLDINQETFADGSSLGTLNQAIHLFDQNRVVPHFNRIEVVVGDAVTTIPEYVQTTKHMTIAMLYLDFDLYEPTKVAIEHFYPLVCKGGLVVFDEFNYKNYAGETEAFINTISPSNARLQKFNYAPFISYFVKD
jgi:hypothetical protein